MKILLIMFCFLSLYSTSALSLVDYSASSSAIMPSKNTAKSTISKRPRRSQRMRVRPRKSTTSSFSMMTFNTSYTNVDNSFGAKEQDVDLYSLGMRLNTPWNIYFDTNFMAGSVSSDEDSAGLEFGNSEVMFGFKWIELGGAYDRMIVDLVAGATFGVEDSSFASERNDKYVGVITQKKFASMDLSLGVEYWFIDDKAMNETSFGGLQKYIASLGWQATSDIRFDLTASFYNLKEVHSLSEGISISEFSPQLLLGLSNHVFLTLGGRFSSGRSFNKSDIGDLRLWNIPSVYGNSLFTNLSFSI